MAAIPGRFEVEDGEIIDTKARQIISLDQFSKLATPEEQASVRQQIQDSGWAGADQTEGTDAPMVARGTVSRPGATDTPSQQDPLPTRPSLQQFMEVAKQDNPDVPDKDLRRYWAQHYSDMDPKTLPSLEAFMTAAKEDNPGVSDQALKAYWNENYGDFGAAEKDTHIGLAGTILEGAKSAGRSLKATGQALIGDEAGVVDTADAQQSAPKDIALQNLLTDIQKRKDALGKDPSWLATIGELGKAALSNPKGAGLLLAEQLPNSAVALGSGLAGAAAGSMLGPIGTIAGGIAGLFAANTALETGGKVIEAGSDQFFTPEERSRTLKEGLTKGAVITAVDTASLGLTNFITGTTARAVERATVKTLTDAGVDVTDRAAVMAATKNPDIFSAVQSAQQRAQIASNTLGQRVARGSGAIGAEAIGEGAGEYLGEYAATGNADKMEAVIEAFAGLGQSAGEIAATHGLNRKREESALLQGSAPTPLESIPDQIGVGNPSVTVEQAIANATGLLSAPVSSTRAQEDALSTRLAQLSATTSAQRETDRLESERQLQAGERLPTAQEAALQSDTVPRTGQDIPILEGSQSSPSTLPIAEPSRLWMDEAVVPGIERGQAFTPRVSPEPDAKERMADERAKLVATQQGSRPTSDIEPTAMSETPPQSDIPLQSAADLAYPPSERGRMLTQAELALRDRMASKRPAQQVPLIEGAQPSQASTIVPGSTFAPRKEPELTTEERLSGEREDLIRQQTRQARWKRIAAEREKLDRMKATRPAPMPSEPTVPPSSTSPDVPLRSAVDRAYPSVSELHDIAREKGFDVESEVFKTLTKMSTGKSHLDELSPGARDRFAEILKKLTPAKTPEIVASSTKKALAAVQPTEPSSDAVTAPRSVLPPEKNAEMLLRAEKASADLESSSQMQEESLIDFLKSKGGIQDQGGELSTMEVDAQRKAFSKKLIQAKGLTLDQAAELAHEAGHIPERDISLLLEGIDKEVRGKGQHADWYRELTTGPKPMTREAIDSAVSKIIEDHGVDTGAAVERVKAALLNDGEFDGTQWGEDAASIARGDWPAWIPKPDALPQQGATPQQEPVSASPSRKGTTTNPPQSEAATVPQEEPFSLTQQADKADKPKPKAAQLSIDVPPPTVGERPIIGREVTPEEAPLFSESAKQPDAQQLDIAQDPEPVAPNAAPEVAPSATEILASALRTAADQIEGKKAESKKPSTPQPGSLTDVGEELWYNRRNRIAGGVKWDDVKDLNDTLKTKEVTKTKVWPRPDYEQLIADGMHPFTAHMVKQMYDSISTVPDGAKKAPTDEELQLYIETVQKLREAIFAWAKDINAQRSMVEGMMREGNAYSGRLTAVADLMKAGNGGVHTRIWHKNPETRRWVDDQERPTVGLVGGNKLFSALQPSFDEAKRATEAIKDGWPAAQEAWQKQFEITLSPKGATVYTQEGKRTLEADEYWIAKKSKSRGHRSIVASGFATRDEAVAKAKELAAVNRGGTGQQESPLELGHIVRTGPDHRTPGQNISPQELKDAFGFRGVNFGNWTNQAERQAHVNHAYDSFMDLAGILNVPPKALSLNGLLGIAFGAQGSGAYAAHFVPGVNEINLTKTQGAGSLAHEWAHALDHYFSVQSGNARGDEPFLTHVVDTGRPVLGEIRPEMVEAVKTIVKTMKKRDDTPEEIAADLAARQAKNLKGLDSWIMAIGRRIPEDKRASYNKIAEKIRLGDVGEGFIPLGNSNTSAISPRVKELRDAFKDAMGHAFTADEAKAIQSWVSSIQYSRKTKVEDVKHVPQRATSYLDKATELDKDKKGKAYWTQPTELLARAFQSYVMDKLAETTRQNDYLTRPQRREPDRYPQGDERTRINAAFDSLVGSLKTEETDAGIRMYNRDMHSDPSTEEAQEVQGAIEGKTPLEAAQYLAQSAPSEDYRLIAGKVAERIEALQSAGMTFSLHVAHVNDKVPAALIRTRGMAWLPNKSTATQIWIQGSDVTGYVGTSYETVLHELLHAATQSALYVGNLRSQSETTLGRAVKDLYDVTNAIIGHFNDRSASAKRGETELTPFERAIFERRNNALSDPGEVISWAFTNRDMQQYLESIPYRQQTLWSRFVDAIRSMLGLSAKQGTALSEVLRLGEEIMDSPANSMANSLRAVWMPTQVNQYGGLLNAQRNATDDIALTYDDLNSPNFPGITAQKQQAALTYHLPAMSRMDNVIRSIQDKNIDLVRLVDSIKQAGAPIPDELNPVLREELYMGRVTASTQGFLNEELRPLVDAMRLNKVTLAQLDQYLHARHAKEANAHLKEINPDREDNDALSGMTDAEAERILAASDKPKMDRLAAKVDAILGKTRQMLVEYGLESQATVDGWAKDYQFYVPLHREGYEDGKPGTGQGRSVRGSHSKSRTGSTLSVTNIMANVAMDRERAIVRGEKMRPVIALAGLLQQYPNKDIATLAKPSSITYTNQETGLQETAAGDIGEYRVPRIKGINKKTGMVEWRPDPLYKGRDNVINFRINGQDHAIIFNEENDRAVEMAKSLKDLDVGRLNGVLAAIAPATRYLSSISTQYNPVFGVVNFVRDIQFAMLSLSSTPLSGKRAEIFRGTFRALRGIYADARAERKGERVNSEMSKLWERFQKVGGPTGYREMFRGSNDRAKAIEHMLDPDWWQQTLGGKILTANGHLSGMQSLILNKAAKPLFEWLSDYNQTMENAVRLATFKAGLDSGMTDEQAASTAKNLTVNFNKKGAVTTQVGAMYAFFNASVQGTARIADTLFEKGRFGYLSATGKKIVAGGIALGSMQALGLMLAGFGEDEPPEFVRARSLILPMLGTEKGYLALPMPLGFNILPNFGRLVTESLIHGKPMDRAYTFMANLVDTFSPVGGAGSVSQFLAPSVADPLVALSENKDWAGRKISKEDFNAMKPTPGHTRAKDSSTPWARGLSEMINYATGGTNYVPGKFSPTPDAIDYLIGSLTGGVGRELAHTAQSVTGLATGEDVPLHKVPLVGRFVGDAAGPSAVRNDFYENLSDVHQAYEEVHGRLLHHEDATDFLAGHPEARFEKMATHLQREISQLTKRKREMVAKGENRERVRLLEMQIASRMQRFNDRVKELQETR